MTANEIIMAAAGNSISQPYWMATFGASSYEVPTYPSKALVVDASGNIYACGTTQASGGINDIYVVKYSATGVLQWQRVVNSGGSADYGYSVCVDSSGNVFVSGGTTITTDRIFVIKYNNSGVLQWQYTLDGASTDWGEGIAVGASGDIYVTGYTLSAGAGSADVLIAKISSAGSLIWQRLLGDAGYQEGRSIALDSSDNVYVCGVYGSAQGFIAKYNSSGSIQWQRRLTGIGSKGINDIAVSASGDVHVAAYTSVSGSNGGLVMKYNTSGVLQWQRVLDVGTGTEFFGVAVDSGGNVYANGYGYTANSSAYICRYSPTGSLIWQRYFSTGECYGYSIAAANASVYAYIEVYTQGGGGSDLVIAKLPDDGSLTSACGSLNYTASSFTEAAGAVTDAAGTLTDQAASLTWASSSLVDQAGTMSSMTNTVVTPYWIARAVGTYGEQIYGLACDNSNNLYAAGSSASIQFGSGSQYAGVLYKYDVSGNVTWKRFLQGASYNTEFYGVGLDPSGNVYVTGYTASMSAGVADAFVAKYNSSGTLQWQRYLGGSGSDNANAIAVDASGNSYITGLVSALSNSFIAKYDTSGALQWQRVMASAQQGRGITLDRLGNVYVCGDSSSTPWVFKYTTAGSLVWQKQFTGIGQANSIVVDPFDQPFFTGSISTGGGAGGNDLFIIKLTTAGAISSQRLLGTASNDGALSLVSLPNYGVIAAGYTAGQGAGSDDGLVCRWEGGATPKWQRTFGGTGADYLRAVALDLAGNLYVGGGNNGDIVVAKIPSGGSLTGTYGGITYAASTLTMATPTISVSNSTYTDSAGSMTDAAATLVTSSVILTDSKTMMQGT